MAKYIVKRVILAVITMFLICFITFFAMNAIPGGPFSKEKAPSAAVQAVLEQTEITLHEKSEERDARQAEIAELDGKISEAHAAMLSGMEAVTSKV